MPSRASARFAWKPEARKDAVTRNGLKYRVYRTVNAFFSRLAHWTAHQCGRPHAFSLACLLIILWAATGPLFGFSDTWQLIINTTTTIITFLMVFLIQSTQNRDTAAIQLKLDELIRANQNARNALLSLEDLTEDQLSRIKSTFSALAEGAKQRPEDLTKVRKDIHQAGREIGKAKDQIEETKRRLVATGTGGHQGSSGPPRP
jgi:low affinity Fe/Cu permease